MPTRRRPAPLCMLNRGVSQSLLTCLAVALIVAGPSLGATWVREPNTRIGSMSGIWGAGPNDIYAVGTRDVAGVILHYDGTSWQPVPVGTVSRLTDVAGNDGNDVFAVGQNGTVLHYDGAGWSTMNSGTTANLWRISCAGPHDAFVVGPGFLGGPNAILRHFDGSTWTDMPLPTNANLWGIWASSPEDAYAVGDYGTILHYDGISWTQVTSGTSAWLLDVWGSGPNDVFVVGDEGTILHFNGASWQPLPPVDAPLLFAVWGNAPNNVYAVGGYSEAEVLHYDGTSWSVAASVPGTELVMGAWGAGSDTLYFAGTSGIFRGPLYKLTTSVTPNYFGSITVEPNLPTYAPGSFVTLTAQPGSSSLFSRWTGDVPEANATDTSVTITMDRDRNVTAGFVPADTLTIELNDPNGGTVEVEPNLSKYPVGSVVRLTARPAEGYVFASWEIGGYTQQNPLDVSIRTGFNYYRAVFVHIYTLTILLRDPNLGTYSVEPNLPVYRSGAPVDLTLKPLDGYPVCMLRDERGNITYSSGMLIPMTSNRTLEVAFWRQVECIPFDRPYRLTGLWGSSPTNVFAVGTYVTSFTSVIAHYDGVQWTRETFTGSRVLMDVSGNGPNDIYAVGENGTILHYDGTAWSSMPSLTTDFLCGVWCSGPNDIFATGFGGTILHYDGTNWSRMNSNNQGQITGLWGSGPNNIMAASSEGVVLRHDGSTWSSMDTGATDQLWGIWGTGPNDVYAVGVGGTVVHYDGITWSKISLGTTETFFGVWASGPNDVYILGTGPSYHYDGRSWWPAPVGTGGENYAIWGTGPDDIFLVGDGRCTSRYPIQYRLTARPNIEGWGDIIVEPNRTKIPSGTWATVTARPADGFGFGGWTGTLPDPNAERDNPLRVRIGSNNLELTAVFYPIDPIDPNHIQRRLLPDGPWESCGTGAASAMALAGTVLLLGLRYSGRWRKTPS